MTYLYVLISLSAIAFILIANESVWRHKSGHKEHYRKAVHMLVGVFVSLWPYYLSWNEIRLISLAFLIVVAVSKILNIFASIHEVERFSVGEISFALAVGLITYATKTDWIYTAALLQMSLADGLAAIIGVHFGRKNSYKVFGAKKSIAGTLAFFIVSIVIFSIINYIASAEVSFWVLLGVSALITMVENTAVYGFDNLLIPLVSALILTRL